MSDQPPEDRREATWLDLLVAVPYLYPVMLVGLQYATWFVARIVLGHVPRPMVDDPKYIGWQVDVPHSASWVLLIGYPYAFLASLIFLIAFLAIAKKAPMVSLALLAGLVVLWAIPFALVSWDPGNVFEWFYD